MGPFPNVFCVLSDVVLPYFSGKILGVDMEFHICFHRELENVLPFLCMGILNGLILRKHHTAMLRMFSLGFSFHSYTYKFIWPLCFIWFRMDLMIGTLKWVIYFYF